MTSMIWGQSVNPEDNGVSQDLSLSSAAVVDSSERPKLWLGLYLVTQAKVRVQKEQ